MEYPRPDRNQQTDDHGCQRNEILKVRKQMVVLGPNIRDLRGRAWVGDGHGTYLQKSACQRNCATARNLAFTLGRSQPIQGCAESDIAGSSNLWPRLFQKLVAA